MTKNKFEERSKAELVRLCMEQEAELETLRPKPNKFKLNQIVILEGRSGAFIAGQPHVTFKILSLEYRNGEWHYGYSRMGSNQPFLTYPEKKLRALSAEEKDGTPPEPAVSINTTPGPASVAEPLAFGGEL